MLTQEFKTKVKEALKERFEASGSTDKGFAGTMNMLPTQWDRVKVGNFYNVLTDGQWIALARKCGLDLNGNTQWKTAITPVYKKIYAQLKKCQTEGISSIFCDEAGIGKSYTAKQYAKENKYAMYVDCSQVKSKSRLVRMMAEKFGCECTGRYRDIYMDLVNFINSAAQNPIIILDEAGDLDYPAFLELKALWNATEGACAWYMMGADGLKAKMDRCIDSKRVGYTELFSRYGKRYQRATPQGTKEYKEFSIECATKIIKANAPEGTNVQEVLGKLLKRDENDHKSDKEEAVYISLRRIPTELSKLKPTEKAAARTETMELSK